MVWQASFIMPLPFCTSPRLSSQDSRGREQPDLILGPLSGFHCGTQCWTTWLAETDSSITRSLIGTPIRLSSAPVHLLTCLPWPHTSYIQSLNPQRTGCDLVYESHVPSVSGGQILLVLMRDDGERQGLKRLVVETIIPDSSYVSSGQVGSDQSQPLTISAELR